MNFENKAFLRFLQALNVILLMHESFYVSELTMLVIILFAILGTLTRWQKRNVSYSQIQFKLCLNDNVLLRILC